MIRDESGDRRQERAPAWLGPIRVPTRLAVLLRQSAEGLATQLGPWPVWLLVGALAGALPLALDYLLGWSQTRWTTPLLVSPLLLAAVSRGAAGRGIGTLAAAFAAHSTLAVVLAIHAPNDLARACAGGADYWERSHTWIVTGVSREYDLGWWMPAHAQLLAVMVLFCYTSLGLIPLWEGLYEVD